jgi:hypothetical protein
MIRYPITKTELAALVDAVCPGWRADAAKRTDKLRQQGCYANDKANWSKVKPVFMRHQGGCKCVFCERKMESVDYGTIEQDIEHYRPKGNIRKWPEPSEMAAYDIKYTPVPEAGKGYYLLPYNLFNYAASCKPCNSGLKKDYFPIAGTYDLGADDPAGIKGEKPYLIYPIGDIDDDPEDLIEFKGTSPCPKAKSGHKRKRAQVTIAFFRLDDTAKRNNLHRERAQIIMLLWPLLEKTVMGTSAEQDAARTDVDDILRPSLPHLNCAKSFRRLFEADPTEAQSVYVLARKLVAGSS